ncbi:hypothetical protein H4R18_004468 [Coemansia javaensis]|uniref:Protein kinase domain-containing protein n=1 Tax=Coemansia javaensis TaxID=2761396 RepID=A0A9W8HBK1_9FUNG|nr:hypothetical protein H4R18_004468 [Coemansia javaensis]
MLPLTSLHMEIAAYTADRDRLGDSPKDKAMRERISAAISAIEGYLAIQTECDLAFVSAREESRRLTGRYMALLDEQRGSEPQAKRAKARRGAASRGAAVTRKELESAKLEFEQALHRLSQITKDYEPLLYRADAAAQMARDAVLRSKYPRSMTPSRSSADSARSSTAVQLSSNLSEDTRCLSAEVSEDDDFPEHPDPSVDIDPDMERALSQDLRRRKRQKIWDTQKLVFVTTWNDGRKRIKAVVKAVHRDNPVSMDAAGLEVAAYQRLRPLQGTCVPRLLDYGNMVLDGTRYFALVLEYIRDREQHEMSMPDDRQSVARLNEAEKTACRKAIKRIHRLGVLHGCLASYNILFRDDVAGPNRVPIFISYSSSAIYDNRDVGDMEYDYTDFELIFTS